MKSKSASGLKTTSRFGKRIIISVIVILIILAISLFLIGRNYLKSSLKPLDSQSTKAIQINIPFGASNRKIGSILQNHKVVKNGLVFNYYIKSHDIKDLKAGYYRLSPSMSLRKISLALKKGGTRYPIDLKNHYLVISKDSSPDDIVRQLSSREFPAQVFLNLMSNHRFVKRVARKYPRLQITKSMNKKIPLEGYLSPGKYSYNSRTSFRNLIIQMVAKTNRRLKPYFSEICDRSLTVPQMMALAYPLKDSKLGPVNEHALFELLARHNDGQNHHFKFYAADSNGKLLVHRSVFMDYNKQKAHSSYLDRGVARNILSKRLNDRVNTSSRLYFMINPKTSNVYYLNGTLANRQQVRKVINKYDLLK